jgi:hypothetical protein
MEPRNILQATIDWFKTALICENIAGVCCARIPISESSQEIESFHLRRISVQSAFSWHSSPKVAQTTTKTSIICAKVPALIVIKYY